MIVAYLRALKYILHSRAYVHLHTAVYSLRCWCILQTSFFSYFWNKFSENTNLNALKQVRWYCCFLVLHLV